MATLIATGKGTVRTLVGERQAHRLLDGYDRLSFLGNAAVTRDARRSFVSLARCHDEFRGRRAVIIGNGPSLRDTDLGLLAGEYTFGLNRIYLAFEDMGFPTTFLVAVNRLLVSQVAHELADVPCRKFFGWSSRPHMPEGARDITYLRSARRPGFSRRVRHRLWEGSTVTYVAMQLAYHMGFSQVVLVGVDHSFASQGAAHAEVVSGGADPNHFHPEYFGKGFRWQLPDLEGSEVSYERARRAFEADGRSIVDATVGGHLRVFPRVPLEQALRG